MTTEIEKRVGKYFRFRLADFQSFGEVNVIGWGADKRGIYAMCDTYDLHDAAELFDRERDALEAAVSRLRDEEQRIYNERRALEARLDAIKEAEVEVEQNLDGDDWDDIERAGLKPPPLRTSSTKGYK